MKWALSFTAWGRASGEASEPGLAAASSLNVECRLVFERYQTCDLKDPTAVCTITGKLFTDKVSLAGSVRLHPPRTLEGRA